MKPLLKYPLLIFGLLIIFNSKVQASPYCSSADFVALYDSSWQCNEKKIWAPHFKKHQSSIKLNADVYRLMGDVNRKVVKELNKKKRSTGRDQSHLFYDLLYKYRKEIYDNNYNELIAKIPKGYCEATGGWVPCDLETNEEKRIQKEKDDKLKRKNARIEAEKEGNAKWISEHKQNYLYHFIVKLDEYSKTIQILEDNRKKLNNYVKEIKNKFEEANKDIKIAFDDLANINQEIKDRKREIRENKKTYLSKVIIEDFEDRLKEINKINFKKYANYLELKKIIKKAKKSNSAKDFVGKDGYEIKLPKLLGGGIKKITSEKLGFIEEFENLEYKSLGPRSKIAHSNMVALSQDIQNTISDVNEFILKPNQELVALDDELSKKIKYINLLKSNPFYWFYNLINKLLYDFL